MRRIDYYHVLGILFLVIGIALLFVGCDQDEARYRATYNRSHR